MRLKLTLEYDGTRFRGWAAQPNLRTVEGVMRDAVGWVYGSWERLAVAGRTDTGVHALGQVASAQVTFAHDATTLTRALNAQLPEDIRVLAVEDVSPEFHARFNARSKTYRYQIRHGTIADPFERAYVWHMPESLRVDAMRAAAGVLIGTHDFAAFQSIGTPVRDSVRTVTQSTLTDAEGRMAYEISGDGFLRHMVRAIVGTLVEIGRGFREPESMASLLRGSARSDAGPTAPPQGLFLVRVDYH